MGEDNGEKTEQPTPHKLREARKKGQIAKSKEITGAILLLVSFYTFKAVAPKMWQYMTGITERTFATIPLDFNASVAGMILMDMLKVTFFALMPVLLVTFVSAIFIEALQTKLLVSFDPLIPKFDKLNPIEGIKKMFTMKQIVELVKSIIKMSLVIWLLYNALVSEFDTVLVSQQLSLWQIMAFTGKIILKVISRLSILYLGLAVLDYLYQQYEYIKSMKMSKKEIRDEYKRLEGNPMIKQRQRDAARQMSMGRQMGKVPGADVVVTNPTEFAVAIQYDPKKALAPIVIAKGVRILAKEIREIAEANQVPIVENPPLARALYKHHEAQSTILPEYYKAVAEILAFVYNLKKKSNHKY